MFDFATFSNDESIADTTVELNGLLGKLATQGKYQSGRLTLDLKSEKLAVDSKGGLTRPRLARSRVGVAVGPEQVGGRVQPRGRGAEGAQHQPLP